MIFPFIKLTQVYNDDTAEKYDRPIHLLPELIEYFTSFEVGYNGRDFVVKENEKEIKKKLVKILNDIHDEDKLDGGAE